MGKKRKKIESPFVPLLHPLMESEAFKSMCGPAKVAYLYFLRDVRSGHQEEVILTFGQAKKYGVCKSPSTFDKAKKQLVKHGLLDPVDGGGLNFPAVFKKSSRWRLYGTDRFKDAKYISGHGSKYFRDAMKDDKKRKMILNARHKPSA